MSRMNPRQIMADNRLSALIYCGPSCRKKACKCWHLLLTRLVPYEVKDNNGFSDIFNKLWTYQISIWYSLGRKPETGKKLAESTEKISNHAANWMLLLRITHWRRICRDGILARGQRLCQDSRSPSAWTEAPRVNLHLNTTPDITFTFYYGTLFSSTYTGWSKKWHKVDSILILQLYITESCGLSDISNFFLNILTKTARLCDVRLQNYGVVNFVPFFLVFTAPCR